MPGKTPDQKQENQLKGPKQLPQISSHFPKHSMHLYLHSLSYLDFTINSHSLLDGDELRNFQRGNPWACVNAAMNLFSLKGALLSHNYTPEPKYPGLFQWD